MKLVKSVPEISYTKNYFQANESFKNAFTKYILKGGDAAAILKEANEEVKSKIN